MPTALTAAAMLMMGATTVNADTFIEPGRQVETRLEVTLGSGDAARQVVMPYLLFGPQAYGDADQRWPLLLFLHGAGECGNGNLDLVKKHGPPKLVANRKNFPFVVVSPQCPRPRDNKFRPAWKADTLIALVDHVVQNARIDPTRIYVTGLSMGGFGTWRLAAAYPDRFAAAVPICGGGDTATAKRLAGLPIWCFHGGRDNVVPVAGSQRMVDAVKAAGGNVRLTIYPKAGHDSWTETYNNEAVYEWLLSHRRKDAGKVGG